MNLYLRMLWTLFCALRKPRVGALDEVRISLVPLPVDVEVRHVNNGRYLSLMDLGRLDWLVRSGHLQRCWRERLFPVIASATVRYRRPLSPFTRYTLITRLVHWDEKWCVFEQRIERDGKLHARAVLRGLLRGKGRNVPTCEAIPSLADRPLPAPPAWYAALDLLEQTLGEEPDAGQRAA